MTDPNQCHHPLITQLNSDNLGIFVCQDLDLWISIPSLKVYRETKKQTNLVICDNLDTANNIVVVTFYFWLCETNSK